MNQETPVDALNRAVAKAGSQSALASMLSSARGGEPITAARVWNWVNRDKKAPAEFCPDIEALTGVACEHLCPDANWSVLRKSTKAKRRKPELISAEGAPVVPAQEGQAT